MIEATFSPEMRKKTWDAITMPLTTEARNELRKALPEKGFVFPNPKFDNNGLRFDIDYLNRIGGSICVFPLEFMADYVDVVCKESIDKQEGKMEQDILADDATDESLVDINATALGNLSYIVLHTKDELAKAKCLDIIWRYLNIYFDNMIKAMLEQSNDGTIN